MKSKTLGLVKVEMRDGDVNLLSPARARALAGGLLEQAGLAEQEELQNPAVAAIERDE